MPRFYGQNKKRIDPRYFLNESVEREDLIDMIRDYSKELTGYRDTYGDIDKLVGMDLEELKLYYKDLSISPEAEDLRSHFRDEEEAAMGTDQPEDAMPKQQGFGRQPNADRPWPKRS